MGLFAKLGQSVNTYLPPYFVLSILKFSVPNSTHKNINMVLMTGNFERTREEKYNDFLSKLGVGMLMRKAATSSTPTMEITESGGKWKVVTKTTLKSTEINFEVGKPFEETTADGRKCTTTVTIEGNTMVTDQK